MNQDKCFKGCTEVNGYFSPNAQEAVLSSL